MSVSLYRWTEACDAGPCPGDCDCCHKNEEDKEDEEQNTTPPVVIKAKGGAL